MAKIPCDDGYGGYRHVPDDYVPRVGEVVFYQQPRITSGFVHTETEGSAHMKCAACGKPFRGDPKANVCNTCATNGNYVNAVYTDSNEPAAYIPMVGDGALVSEFVDVSRLADRVSREYAQERQLQLQEYAEARSWARPKGTIDSVKETFVKSPPRDDTGYIDTTQLEHDIARILEAQGPDWYLQPDEPDTPDERDADTETPNQYDHAIDWCASRAFVLAVLGWFLHSGNPVMRTLSIFAIGAAAALLVCIAVCLALRTRDKAKR